MFILIASGSEGQPPPLWQGVIIHVPDASLTGTKQHALLSIKAPASGAAAATAASERTWKDAALAFCSRMASTDRNAGTFCAAPAADSGDSQVVTCSMSAHARRTHPQPTLPAPMTCMTRQGKTAKFLRSGTLVKLRHCHGLSACGCTRSVQHVLDLSLEHA